MKATPTIVSIQPQLVYGCAGNNAAVPLFQRMGANVLAIPTTLLSNTPHYPTTTGTPLDAELVGDLLHGLLDRVEPKNIDAILTGYIGSAGTATIAAKFIERVRESHPDVIVLCDPVMGDADCGLYVTEDVADAIKMDLAGHADILTPNVFEAQRLARSASDNPVQLLDGLLRGRTSIGVITGIPEKNGHVSTVAGDARAKWAVTTEHLALRPTGTGDILSAAFLHRFLLSRDIRDALETGVATVYGMLQYCHDNSAAELQPHKLIPDLTTLQSRQI